MSPAERGATLRRLIIDLDRIWGDAALGLALCEQNRGTVAELAALTDSTPATTRRRLERLTRINRVTIEFEGNQYVYVPNSLLCIRTAELLEKFPLR